MQELNNKIIEWADNKGILSNSDPLKQLKKTFEEITELVCGLVDKNQPEIKDAIGDVNVTLIILKKLSESAKVDGELANSRIFMTINWVVEIFNKLTKNKDVSLDIIRAQEMLSRVAHENKYTLEECTQSAYEIISKRTGKMVDGIFVKDIQPSQESKGIDQAAVAKKNRKSTN
ncbi:MazG-like family protein [Sphingobacterium thalpophilum]|uniref:MazG-like family protein n=1 Tax=Sphingobacterium thalpophilum TaxID=259 RepID=UPI0024A6567F|nr:MazG-like family protein [Sphingobacterium thalpophilum]